MNIQPYSNACNLEYVFVDESGGIIYPDKKKFHNFLKDNGLEHIRLHDLRHSVASLLLANGIQIKQIQEWLCHSNFATTADIYSHLDFNSKVQSEEIDNTKKWACEEIEERYFVRFLEVGTDKDHVHFLVQAPPKKSPSQIIQMIKSIIAREVFTRRTKVKKKLWGGELWSSGYYVATVVRKIRRFRDILPTENYFTVTFHEDSQSILFVLFMLYFFMQTTNNICCRLFLKAKRSGFIIGLLHV